MYEYRVADIVKIVDGDTLDLTIDLGFYLFKQERVRVAGIDAPESRTRNLDEKRLGLQAKDFVTEQLAAAESIIIRSGKSDKYGRFLGWLYLNGSEKSLNEIMIEWGYAWPYDGGKKHKDLDTLIERRKATGHWTEPE